MPTVLILIFTLFIMVTVIPYAFSNVIKQLQAVRLLEQQQGGSNKLEKLREAFIKKRVTFFTLGSAPPLFSGKCNKNPKKIRPLKCNIKPF